MVSSSEKKEKSLAELLVNIALIGVMMAMFINFYIKNESKYTQAGFGVIAQTFNTKVTAVHAQWMMDKQPNVVYLGSLNSKEKQAISVNKAGWVDVIQTQLPCELIWQLVMDRPINEMQLSLSAIEVRSSIDKHKQEIQKKQITRQDLKTVPIEESACRYVMLDGSYFQYNRQKGKVSKIMVLE